MEMELGKLFIGGISWETNEDNLREYFERFGEVVEAVIMKDRITGRARGFGFVIFADPSVAEKVVMEKHCIDGRNVEAKKAVPREDQNILNRNHCSKIAGSPSQARTKKIFVGGLASTVTETDFKKYFAQFGTIIDVVVMYDHNTQRPRGFGFITFDLEEAVDKVLHKTFHELNGKMVEVKRAVPKEELFTGTTRSPSTGHNCGTSRVSSILNDYTHGYKNPSVIGGLSVRMDGRFSPVNVGRSNFSPFGSGFGQELNFEQGLSLGYGGNSNLIFNLGYGNLSRNDNLIGFNGGNDGNSSFALSSTTRTLRGSGSTNHALNSTDSNNFMASGSWNSGMGSFGHIGGSLWDSSANSGQGGGFSSAYSNGNLSYNNGDNNVCLGYGRNNAVNVAPVSSHAALSYDDMYENVSTYGDFARQSSPLELEGSSRPFRFGVGNAASNVVTRNSAGYVGDYSVANGEANRGIAA